MRFDSWCGLASPLVSIVLGLALGGCDKSPEARCRRGDGVACGQLADAIYHAPEGERDLGKACSLYRQACDAKNYAGCTSLGALLGQQKCTGTSGEALSVLQAACDHDDASGCNNLGMLYRDGAGGASIDAPRATTLFRGACKTEATACDNLGSLLLKNGDEPAAIAAFSSGCDLPATDKVAAACCFKLGLSYEHGRGVAVDKARALSLYTKACDGAIATACYFVGVAELANGDLRDRARAATHFREACASGMANGCNNLGLMYAEGLGVAKNVTLAAEFLQKGCDGGDLRACANVGSRYILGDGVARDPARGKLLVDRACDGGISQACKPPPPLTDSDGGSVPAVAPAR